MSDGEPSEERLERAADALDRGGLVVYPTETVYGLGADALDADAVSRVFDVKDRPRDRPLSIAVPDLETARSIVEPTERELAFMREFLPGPVTVVCARRAVVPAVVTGESERVGVRVPDHPLTRALLERIAPITATSANVSGTGSARRVADLDPRVVAAAAVVLDGGETAGTESTVVDVEAGRLHRPGAMADAVAAWLDAH